MATTRTASLLDDFLVAILATGSLVLVRYPLSADDSANVALLPPFLAAVIVAAGVRGFRAGLLATLLAMAVGLFVVARASGTMPTEPFWMLLVVFGLAGVALSKVADSVRAPGADAHERDARFIQKSIPRISDSEERYRELLAQEMMRRESAESTLREREEHIRLAVECADIGTWDFDPQTMQVKASPRCKAMYGLATDREYSLDHFLERIHQDDRQIIQTAFESSIDPQGPGVFDIEYRTASSAGQIRWLVAKGQTFFAGSGRDRRAVRVMGIVNDVSQHKQADLALRQANEKFRVLATDAPVGIFQTDAQGACLFVNHHWCEIAGGTPEEAMGAGWASFVHPDDLERIGREWQAAVSERRNHTSEFRFVNRRTGTRDVVASSTVILNLSGEVSAYVGSIVDVTDRKAAEDKVRASQARLQGILDNAPMTIYLKDLEGRFLMVNNQVEVEKNTGKPSILGLRSSDFLTSEAAAQIRDYDRQVVESGRPTQVEMTYQLADGLHTYITVRFPVRDAEGKITAIGGISSDITDRKKTQESLETEQELLRHTIELQEQERQLITFEIHDGIVQYATGALMQLDAVRAQAAGTPLAEPIADIVEILRRTVEEGRRIINGIRTPVLDGLGIVAAVEQLIEDEDRAHVRYEFVKDEGLGRMSPQIEETLYRITQEALTNIGKHSQTKQVRIELGRQEDRVRLEVRDWGIGFKPTNGSKNVHGLKGISRRAKLAGGQCTIESTPGQGTKIMVDLPYEQRV